MYNRLVLTSTIVPAATRNSIVPAPIWCANFSCWQKTSQTIFSSVFCSSVFAVWLTGKMVILDNRELYHRKLRQEVFQLPSVSELSKWNVSLKDLKLCNKMVANGYWVRNTPTITTAPSLGKERQIHQWTKIRNGLKNVNISAFTALDSQKCYSSNIWGQWLVMCCAGGQWQNESLLNNPWRVPTNKWFHQSVIISWSRGYKMVLHICVPKQYNLTQGCIFFLGGTSLKSLRLRDLLTFGYFTFLYLSLPFNLQPYTFPYAFPYLALLSHT